MPCLPSLASARLAPLDLAHHHVRVDADHGGEGAVGFLDESLGNIPRRASMVGTADKSKGLGLDGSDAVGDFARLQSRGDQGAAQLTAACRSASPIELDDVLARDDLGIGGGRKKCEQR